jgi:HAD superfamily hydrolase (TIGR01490 family)
MQLALFDLDHTLLPLDSDYEWGRFLERVGAVDAQAHRLENDRFYREYVAGTMDIGEFLAFQLAPLAAFPPAQLDAWHEQYMDEVIRPAIRPAARALVERHARRGDLCAIVTATNEFVTAPIARLFGVEHLVATLVERIDGRCTGRPAGTPNYREGKIVRTEAWLASLGQRLDGFERSWFYSDSANDIPLLSRVSDPVATNPDARLGAFAVERGWTVLRLFDDAGTSVPAGPAPAHARAGAAQS